MRIDQADGHPYTFSEFLDEYGGTREWELAVQVQPMQSVYEWELALKPLGEVQAAVEPSGGTASDMHVASDVGA
jgi:hypothetical protein